MNIIETNLDFAQLYERDHTDLIVIHHTGANIDASAAQVHDWHLQNGWSGCGYHFIIRKSGVIERGRPLWAVGSHAQGFNSNSVGIHLSGDFNVAQPSAAQIDSLVELIKFLCNEYDIPCDRQHIVGHQELMSTDCPGKYLFNQLDNIVELAKGVSYSPRPVENIFDLARRYESEDNCGAVGEGYGLYQFTKKTVERFIDWLMNYRDDKLANYGKVLFDAQNFDGMWTMLATTDPGHFSQLQTEFALVEYYLPACKLLAKEHFNVDKHSLPLQAVVFSRAVQHGIFGCREIFIHACRYPNLSYVDDSRFDNQLIADVYDYLIKNQPELKRRWLMEKADACA